MISEATDHTLPVFLGYTVRGVHYTASQDISALRGYLPADPHRLIGVAGLKYSSKNPANSILVMRRVVKAESAGGGKSGRKRRETP